MAKKKTVMTNAMRMLKQAKIDYDIIEYETDEVTGHFGEKVSKITGLPAEISFKTLVAKGDKNGIMVALIPVNEEVDLKKLAKASGNKSVAMIHVKELLDLTGYIRGGVSPIGMKKKYPTYVNNSCENVDKIAVSGGVCGITLVMTPSDLLKVIDGSSEDIIQNN